MKSSSPFVFPSNPSFQSLDSVPLLDVGRENSVLESDILAAITQVTRSGRFVLGPECQQLEQRVARLCKAKHAIGCASGTDALLLALMAVDLQPGDEVIVPSFTFFATASSVSRLGGTPVFVDIDPATFNISKTSVRAAITSRTKAIIPVHLFGQAADMKEINAVAQEHGLTVIEDAAQAICAEDHGAPVGAIGDIGCFSFYPTKNLGGFGDGGMLTTNSDQLADKLRLLRVHGMRPRYYHQLVGTNSRLDTIQAAVLNVKLPNLTAWTDARRANANAYASMIREAGLDQFLVIPRERPGTKHVWNQYTIRVKNGHRNALRDHLMGRNVGAEIYYPVPLHQQVCFESLPKVNLPETERASRDVLSLPIFPTMTRDEQRTVVFRIAEFFKKAAKKATIPHLPTSTTTSQALQSM